MFSKTVNLVTIAVCVTFALPSVCLAARLLTKEQALERVFGKDCEIAEETKELSGEKLANVQRRLKGPLTVRVKGGKFRKVKSKVDIIFYVASKDGKKVGVAVIDEEPGKWGAVQFIIALDLEGTVRRVRVMNYKEKRGRPIARSSFLKQFEGKTIKSRLQVRKDITGISGATISSRAAAFAVKKAIVLYHQLYIEQD